MNGGHPITILALKDRYIDNQIKKLAPDIRKSLHVTWLMKLNVIVSKTKKKKYPDVEDFGSISIRYPSLSLTIITNLVQEYIMFRVAFKITNQHYSQHSQGDYLFSLISQIVALYHPAIRVLYV